MQKLTGKYLFSKTVIHLLFLLMTLVFSIPAFYLFKSGDNSVSPDGAVRFFPFFCGSCAFLGGYYSRSLQSF